MARGDRDRTKQRDQLRQDMLADRHTYQQIAAAMAQQFGDRPRQAWRHAYGWTQQDVADRYNHAVDDKQASMTAHRISDYERWPINGAGVKPTVVPTLAVLAKIYATRVSNLVDHHDRTKMSEGELIGLAIVNSGIVPQQLPSAISNFVGRVHELSILTAQLDRAAADCSAVIITSIGGTAGIGKTTLAVYWARAHIDQFPDGQLYVDLRGFDPSGTPMTPQEAVRGFLDAFQVPVEKIPINLDAQAALYRTLVAGRQLVIVLDNARDSDQVWPLLPGSPTCLVLVTSRQQLGALTARKQALHITLDFMSAAEARQLLTEAFGPDRIHAEPEAVNELIQRCVGLPIALSIAAARILMDDPHVPLSVMVGQLREERQWLGALSTGDSHLTDIRAVFSWSYTALTPQAARLFRLLGLHPGPDISALAAASLAGLPEHDTHTLLTELTRAHLLEEHTPDRYRFHDLLRIYATEQATNEETEPQRRAALHRVLDYCLHTGFTAARHLYPYRDPITLETPQSGVIVGQITGYEQALEWFIAEHAVLLVATNYAATQGFDAHGWQLPWTLATFFNRRGHWHDWVATQQTALAVASRLGDRTAQALAHCELGHAHTRLGRYTEARTHLERALTLYQDLGNRTGQSRTHHVLGWVCEREGQYTEAVIQAQHALTLCHVTDNHSGEANALNNLGWYHVRLGNHQQAITYCQQALDLHRELGDRYSEAHTLDSLGYAHHHLGHHDEAITYYQAAVALYYDLGCQYLQADTLSHLGDTHHATGNVAAAHQAWQQALTIFEQLDHPNAEQVRVKLATVNNDPNIGTDDY